jgi:predicted DNA-binding transcriptional regulator YafY
MAKSTDIVFAKIEVLEYLHASGGYRNLSQILAHLQANTHWGKEQLDKGLPDGGLRTLQLWLEQMRESEEFERQIEVRKFSESEERKELRQHLYKSKNPDVEKIITSPEEACLLLLAQTFLNTAFPTSFYDEALQDLFIEARAKIKHYESGLAPNKKAMSSYIKRIAIAQRGQQLLLKAQQPPHDVLDEIFKAILEKRCVSLTYNGTRRELHPFGLVIREPKIYLLAADDKSMKEAGSKEVVPMQFLCNRITDAKVSKTRNRVPESFDADAFLSKGGLDVRLRKDLGLSDRSFTLKLRVFSSESKKDNLLRDLEEFPLSKQQSIEPVLGENYHTLSAQGMRASHQLVEWILGRAEHVEVRAPAKLRDYIADRIAGMHARYRQDPG